MRRSRPQPHPNYSHYQAMAHPPSPTYDLRERFEALDLGGKTDRTASSDISDAIPGFVGGFNPKFVTSDVAPEAGREPQPADTHWYGKTRPNPFQRHSASVSMPSPQTGHQSSMINTLDSAMNRLRLTSPPPSPPSHPCSDFIPSSPAHESISAPLPNSSLKVNSQPDAVPSPSPTAAASQPISTRSQKPTHKIGSQHRRTVSNPAHLTPPRARDTSQTCIAMTLADVRCSRRVRVPSTYTHLDPVLDVYCSQHGKQVMKRSGVYAHLPGRPDRWIEFNDYIPQYLQCDTQRALKTIMATKASSSDVPGYIYTFEIRDPKRPEVIQFKVGRTVKLTKRLDEWAKQCRSKEQIVRGVWPGTVEDDNDPANGSLLRGRLSGGEKGPLCHRVERLVHIELADLAVHAPYLDPKFPKVELNPPQSGTSPKKKAAATAPAPKPCPDCSKTHKEIFTFRRPKKGQFEGREWDLIVKPVIEKWGKFVADHYPGEPSMDG
ncbi:hypothetical protein BV22DRAFT_306785 [Leucogyrophana mollusca]|uniref:Uncharacterized protein n=1 Tax=Leucogyrophana mollusca TaxID=85980 RepID=A0ACB8BMI6_9AGAM|nr:hypothetical protein BV22DRAFT_306785 [Leucogyrophana mollusca]